MQTKSISLILLVLLVWMGVPSLPHATPLITHNGSLNPVSEGWTRHVSPLPIPEGPLTPDPIGGLPAWNINDNSGDRIGGSALWYASTLTPAQITAAQTDGWTLTTRLRVASIPDDPDFGVNVIFVDGVRSYDMYFGTQADGDQVIMLGETNSPFTGPQYVAEGQGNAYHLYQLVFDPGVGSASLFVDNNPVPVLTNYTGKSPIDPPGSIFWGATSSFTTGNGNYNLVEFDIQAVPEPGTLTLVGLGVLGLFGYHWRPLLRRTRKAVVDRSGIA